MDPDAFVDLLRRAAVRVQRGAGVPAEAVALASRLEAVARASGARTKLQDFESMVTYAERLCQLRMFRARTTEWDSLITEMGEMVRRIRAEQGRRCLVDVPAKRPTNFPPKFGPYYKDEVSEAGKKLLAEKKAREARSEEQSSMFQEEE